MRWPMLALAAALACSLPAAAQTTTDVPPAPSGAEHVRRATLPDVTESGGFITAVSPHLMRVSKVIGIGVIGSDPVRIGKVDDVVINREGHAVAVVIATGGFLGMGGKRVGVPFETVLWNTADEARTTPSSDVVTAGAETKGLTPEQATQRMPGGQVSTETLNAQNIGRSGRTDPVEGQASARQAAGGPATELLVGPEGGADHALVRLTRSDLQTAPAFRYLGEGAGGQGR